MITIIRNSTKYKKLNRLYKKIVSHYFIDNTKFLPQGIDRVYHVHIRKSGGSSVNVAFWNLANYDLKKARREPLLIGNKRSIVRYSDQLINEGNYFYASSHFPIWELNLKPQTFTFTILRDPYKRLVSLYKYYKWVEQVDPKIGYELDPSFYVLKSQKHLLNKTFHDFVNSLSDKYLFGNLFMFDKKLNVKKAIENLYKINRICFQDDLNLYTEELSNDLGLELRLPIAQRKFENVNFEISEGERKIAISLLEPEIDFYNKAVELFKQ
jgi:hypothetical protein